LAIVVVVAAWLALVALVMRRAASQVRAGMAAVTAAQSGIQPSTITNGDAADLLAPVKSDFGAARGDLGSPILLPVRLLPVLGRQLLAVRDMASAAEQVATIGQTAVTRVQAALRAPHAAGPARLAAVQSLASAASTADAALSHISLGPHQALIGYVAQKHNEFATKLAKIRSGVDHGAIAAQAVAKMLAGPDRVLILAANNAEMRDGSGMFLSASSAEFSGGEVTVGSFQDTELLQLPAGAVPLTGDLANLWGIWAPNREWRNLGLSPQFGVSAALAAQMWKAKTGQSVDAVMVLDVEAFRVLLDATGPVTSGGQVFDAGNVVQYLLHDQYESVQSGAANFMRREQLSTIAGAVFANLRTGHYDPGKIASQLAELVSGRHVLMWSADPSLERSWNEVGVSGVLPSDALLVSMQNRGANKLDQFLTMSTRLTVDPGPDQTRVTVDVTLRNATPAGEPRYILGGVKNLPLGEYLGYLTVSMPGDATAISLDQGLKPDVEGRDGSTELVATLRTVPQGGSTEVVVSFVLPGRHGQLQLVSAARVPAATYQVVGQTPSVPISDEGRPEIKW